MSYLPEALQEVGVPLYLILLLLFLIVLTVIVFFLVPAFVRVYKARKKVKSKEAKASLIKQPKQFLVAGFAVLLVVTAAGAFYYQNYFQSEKEPVNPQIEKEKVGPRGDFQIDIAREGGKVVVNWDKATKVSDVLVAQLGKDTTDKDNKVVWEISNVGFELPDLKKIDPKKLGKSIQPVATKPPELKYISPPYKLLSKPKGFYYDGTVGSNQAKFKLKTGTRYAVELQGVQKERSVSAFYIFDY